MIYSNEFVYCPLIIEQTSGAAPAAHFFYVSDIRGRSLSVFSKVRHSLLTYQKIFTIAKSTSLRIESSFSTVRYAPDE